MSHGLMWQVNYTYSECLDTFSNGGLQFFNSGSTFRPLPNSNMSRYYGNCDYDVTHSLNGWYLYELPIHPKRTWVDLKAGRWQVSGTVCARGGFPFSVFSIGL